MRRLALAVIFAALAAPVAHADDLTVGQKNKTFTMDTATLKPGDKVNFINDDNIPHNILVAGPQSEVKNSGVQDPGETTTVGFDKSGTYQVECGIHPNMKMTVTVK